MIAYIKIRLPFIEFSGGDGGLEWILLLTLLPFYLKSLFWVYYDAKRRNRGPWAPVALVALGGWPLSVIWWMLLRPDAVDVEKFATLGEPDGAADGDQPFRSEANQTPRAAGSHR